MRQVVDGLQVFSQDSALIDCSPNFLSHNSTDVRAVLLMIRDASGLLAWLLAGGRTVRKLCCGGVLDWQMTGESGSISGRTIYLLSSLARQKILRPPQGGFSVEESNVYRIHG
jgi:hypothetical protein